MNKQLILTLRTYVIAAALFAVPLFGMESKSPKVTVSHSTQVMVGNNGQQVNMVVMSSSPAEASMESPSAMLLSPRSPAALRAPHVTPQGESPTTSSSVSPVMPQVPSVTPQTKNALTVFLELAEAVHKYSKNETWTQVYARSSIKGRRAIVYTLNQCYPFLLNQVSPLLQQNDSSVGESKISVVMGGDTAQSTTTLIDPVIMTKAVAATTSQLSDTQVSYLPADNFVLTQATQAQVAIKAGPRHCVMATVPMYTMASTSSATTANVKEDVKMAVNEKMAKNQTAQDEQRQLLITLQQLDEETRMHNEAVLEARKEAERTGRYVKPVLPSYVKPLPKSALVRQMVERELLLNNEEKKS